MPSNQDFFPVIEFDNLVLHGQSYLIYVMARNIPRRNTLLCNLVPWGNGTIERAYQLMIVITEEIKSKRYF
jgi:hypothetical protein